MCGPVGQLGAEVCSRSVDHDGADLQREKKIRLASSLSSVVLFTANPPSKHLIVYLEHNFPSNPCLSSKHSLTPYGGLNKKRRDYETRDKQTQFITVIIF